MIAPPDPEHLRFPSVSKLTVRADFSAGTLSSDFGSLLLNQVDQQIGLSARIAAAIDDERHPSYITHSVQAILAQRIYQIGLGYVDGNDSNALRNDPMLKLSLGQRPLDEDNDLASAATMSRFENSVSKCDVYRIAEALVEQFIASYQQARQSDAPVSLLRCLCAAPHPSNRTLEHL